MANTCCPLYTISLDAAAFTPSKSQRHLLNRFNSFVAEGGHQGQAGFGPRLDDADKDMPEHQSKVRGEGRPRNKPAKGKANMPTDFLALLHAAEASNDAGQSDYEHAFKVSNLVCHSESS